MHLFRLVFLFCVGFFFDARRYVNEFISSGTFVVSYVAIIVAHAKHRSRLIIQIILRQTLTNRSLNIRLVSRSPSIKNTKTLAPVVAHAHATIAYHVEVALIHRIHSFHEVGCGVPLVSRGGGRLVELEG